MKFTILFALLPLLVSAAPTTEPEASQLGPSISHVQANEQALDAWAQHRATNIENGINPNNLDAPVAAYANEQASGHYYAKRGEQLDVHHFVERAIKETYYVDLFDKNYMWVMIQDTTTGTSKWEHRQMLTSGGPTYSSAAPSSSAVAAKSSSSSAKSSASSAVKSTASSAVSKAASSSASKAAVVSVSASARVSVSVGAASSSKAVASSASSKAAVASSSAKAVVSSASSKAAVASSSAKAVVSSASSKAAVASSSAKSIVSSASSKAAVASSSAKAVVSSASSKAAVASSSAKAIVSSASSKAAVSSTSKAAAVVSSSASVSKPAASSTSSAAAVSATAGVSAADQAQFLALHNDFRAKYSAGKVTWDDSLAAFALKTAQTCKYGHTGGPNGENIAAGVGGGYNIEKAFGSWANEDALYDFSKPGYSSATGHFTQIVWKGTSKIGCAAASCADGTIFTGYRANSTYVVCEYQTPGNIVSSDPARTAQIFTANVGPKA